MGAEAQPDALVLGTLGWDWMGGDWLNSTNNKGEKGGKRQTQHESYVTQEPHDLNERFFKRKMSKVAQ